MKARNLFLLLAGATLLVAGCNKQNPFGGKYSRLPGDEVVFGVGTKSVETRTEYGDVNTVDGKKIQEIKWLQGDKIRIYSPDATRGGVAGKEHWSDYTVNPLATDPNKGTLTHVQSPGLAWKDNGNHTFYSVYPCPAADEGDNPVANGARFGFTMPAAQLSSDEMQYAFMTAAAKENAGVTGDADEAITALIEGGLKYDPDIKCEAHSHGHGCGGDCSDCSDCGGDCGSCGGC